MKVLEDKQVERLITLEFTEAELREIQNMASYYHLRAWSTARPPDFETSWRVSISVSGEVGISSFGESI